MEIMEDCTMNPGKRPAEAAESGPIGSEKRIKESEDQPALEDCTMDQSSAALEDCKMDLGKRPAEMAESESIGSEKRTKISEDQPDDSTDDEFFYADGEFGPELEYWAIPIKPNDYLSDPPKTTTSSPHYCDFCNQVADHQSLEDCRGYKRLSDFMKRSRVGPDRPPPPTSEDLDKKRFYCFMCLSYVDHPRSECPTAAKIGGYKRRADGSLEFYRCCLCYQDNHSGDCPDTPPDDDRWEKW